MLEVIIIEKLLVIIEFYVIKRLILIDLWKKGKLFFWFMEFK